MKRNHLIPIGVAVLAATLPPGITFAASSANASRIEKHVVVESGNAEHKQAKKPVTFLGVEVSEATPALAAQLRLPEGQGLVVNFVQPDSPAARGGLEQHDLLLKLDDQILIGARQLSVLVRGHKEGDTVTLTYVRGGAEGTAKVTLATREMEVGAFHWKSGGFSVPFPEGFTEQWGDRFEGNMRHLRVPAPMVPGVPHGSRVMIFRPKANIVFTDDEGTLELTTGEDGQTLRAKDADGKMIFEGPVSTDEQRNALPEDLRVRLEKLETIEIEAPEAPPAPAVAPVAPVPPVLALPATRGDITSVEAGSEPLRVEKTDTPMVLAL